VRAEGVVEVAEEVVGEEFLGSMELVVGSVGSGSNRRRLPSAGCSQRKTTVRELPLPSFARRRRGQALGAGGAR
jgi:hypothetical protein